MSSTDEIEILPADQIVQRPGMKITRGVRLLMPVINPPHNPRPHEGYWKFGVKLEVYHWLVENIGKSSSYLDWETRESNDGFWLYTGAQFKYSEPHKMSKLYLNNFWFPDKDRALLFKLVWAGRT